jgi:hypothetical protein
MNGTTMAVSSGLKEQARRAVIGAHPNESGVTPERFLLPSVEKTIMKQLKRLSSFFIAIALVSVLGCAGTSTKESSSEYVTDSWITTKVKAALIENPRVKATEVNVETFKGTVQLSGFVSSNAALQEAIHVARNIQGVTSVKNDMRIK